MNNKSVNVQQIFNNMQGIWTIDRIFKPSGSGSLSSVFGQATIQPSQDNSLLYFEEINLFWPNGKKKQAYQSYIYSLQNNVITKFQNYSTLDNLSCRRASSKMFDLEFLPFTQNSESIIAMGIFYCHQDVYEAKFIFEHTEKFNIEYKVTGPNKDYHILTNYIKYSCLI